MAASFFIDVPRRCVFSRAWGELVDDDLFGHTFAIREHPLFGRDLTQIVDYRGVEQVMLSTECVRQLAEHNPWRSSARRSFIMTQGLLVGLARVYQMSGKVPAEGVKIFESWEDACAWTGLDPAIAWPSDPPHWHSPARARKTAPTGAE